MVQIVGDGINPLRRTASNGSGLLDTISLGVDDVRDKSRGFNKTYFFWNVLFVSIILDETDGI